MKQVILSLLFLQMTGIQAQSLIDNELERATKQVVYDMIDENIAPDINYLGVVIMDKTGAVKANVSLKYDSIAKFGDFPGGNGRYYYSGLGRSLLYMCLVPKYRSPFYVVNTGNGIYKDSISGGVVLDSNWKRGGYLEIDLKRAQDRSDVGMVKAAEACFNRSMARLGREMQRTGMFLGASVCEDEDAFWDNQQVIGYTTRMSLLQQTAWVNALYTGKIQMRFDETDSMEPIDVISNKLGSDSLRSAMEEAVIEGLCRRMNSDLVRVAGMSNVSPPDVLNNYGCFAACILPADNPAYSIGVYVNKHNRPAGRALPSQIARALIDWIAFNRLEHLYLPFSNTQTVKHRDGWLHPAAR